MSGQCTPSDFGQRLLDPDTRRSEAGAREARSPEYHNVCIVFAPSALPQCHAFSLCTVVSVISSGQASDVDIRVVTSRRDQSWYSRSCVTETASSTDVFIAGIESNQLHARKTGLAEL